MIFDIHLCVDFMDAKEVEAALKRQASLGMNGVCLSTAGDLARAWTLAQNCAPPDLTVLAAAEVTTRQGTILALFKEMDEFVLSGSWKPRFAGLAPAVAVVNAVHRLDGAVVAAHPYSRNGAGPPMFDNVFTIQGLDAVEVRTGSAPNLANELALEAAAVLGLTGVGGSGTAEGLGKAGTMLARDIETCADLIDALASGEAWPIELEPIVPARGDSARPRSKATPRRRHRNQR